MSYPGNDYQDLFSYLQGEFGVTALQSEMNEIIRIVEKMKSPPTPEGGAGKALPLGRGVRVGDQFMPCEHTEDGYCLRDEGNYCGPNECLCPHLTKFIKTVGGAVTCETTVIACADCGRHLTEPETDC